MQHREDRMIKMAEVCQLTGLSKSTVYRLMNQRRFPQRRYCSERGARWSLREVMAWIDARDGTPPGKWQKPEEPA